MLPSQSPSTNSDANEDFAQNSIPTNTMEKSVSKSETASPDTTQLKSESHSYLQLEAASQLITNSSMQTDSSDQDTEQTSNKDNKQQILKLVIKSKSALFASYMPLILNGGLFVPTRRSFQIGAEVLIIVQLLNDPKPIPFKGTVCWISPTTSGRFQQGVGVQIPDDPAGNKLHQRITSELSAHQKSPTAENLTF